MPAHWRTIPLFISSTFRDMHGERGHLHEVVFPVLEERLRGRRCRLEPIDLRIGVESDATRTEREREVQILKVCLAEIERSRPFLLVLLGDRYGWVPSPDRTAEAAAIAGFATDTDGKSVTALEVEFGLLKKDPLQRRRSLLCLRDPLPYDRMDPRATAIFSDAHGADPAAPERVRRLAALKARILADPDLAGHCLRYRLDWHAGRPEEKSLAAWGARVQEHLWHQLDEETRDRIGATEPTWQDDERYAIEEMVERLERGFVGRTELVGRALALAGSPTGADAPWGLCFTGDSGCGKSALFAKLHHELEKRRDLILLSHAAGITPRAGLTGDLLRRWTGELAGALGEPQPDLADDLTPEDLERQFAAGLARATATRRVVLLVDALNQFLRSDRARTVSWLPALWPPNARFLATSIAGDETDHLIRRPGFALAEVPPLSGADADAIAGRVYGRYHRMPNGEILAALLAKRLADGNAAAGNPLWLTLALDLLNLLDADDLTVAESSTAGAPADKLHRMLRERVQSLPPEVEALYAHFLRHIEKVAGAGATRAFASLLALSRQGWREEDLRYLMPAAALLLAPRAGIPGSSGQIPGAGSAVPASVTTGESRSPIEDPEPAWDPLRFAILRRLFRAHLVKRGALDQWDLAHTRLRTAVRTLLETTWRPPGPADAVPALHALGATYLETSPEAATARLDETVWQVFGTRDAARVAIYYAHSSSGSESLARYLIEDCAIAGHPLRAFVLSLPRCPSLAADIVAGVVNRFNFDLHDALEKEGHLPIRAELLKAGLASIERLAAADPANADWQRYLWVSRGKVGQLFRTGGDLSSALKAFRDSLAIAHRLATVDPANVIRQRDLAVSFERVGDCLSDLGDLAGAVKAHRESLAISRRLAAADPANSDLQRQLAISIDKVGDVLRDQGDLDGTANAYRESLAIIQRLAGDDPPNTDLQCDLARCLCQVGDVLCSRGDLAGAYVNHRDSLAIRKRLAEGDPIKAGWQHDLSLALHRIGGVLSDQGDLAAAIGAFQDALAILQRLVAADPTNTIWQRNLAVSHVGVGDMFRAQGDLPNALKTFRDSLAIGERLARADPSNAGWQSDLAASQERIGDVLRDQGDLPKALEAFRDALAINQRLVEADPANAAWQRSLSVSQERIGDMFREAGDFPNALEAFRDLLAMRKRLAEIDPTNAGWQYDLAISHERIGNVLEDQGDLTGALAAFRCMQDIVSRLTETDPGNTVWQFNLGISHERIGSALAGQGSLADALASFRRKQEIVLRLAESDPTNANWQRDLAVSHGKIGEVLRNIGDLPNALAAFRDSLGIAQRLARTDPSNAKWWRDLAVGSHRIGEVLRDLGDLHSALEAFRESFAAFQRLAEADPSSVSRQRDLSLTLGDIGGVLHHLGDSPGALNAFRDSVAIDQRLADADPANQGGQRNLAVATYTCALTAAAAGKLAEAAKYLQDCHAVLAGMRRRGLDLDSQSVAVLDVLERTRADGYRALVAKAAAAARPQPGAV